LCDELLVIEEIRRLCQVFERIETVAEKAVIQLLLHLPILAQEAVIVVAVLGWVDAHEVASSLVLEHRLNHDFLRPRRQRNEIFDKVFLICVHHLVGDAIDLFI